MVTARLTAVLSSAVTVPLTLPTGPGRAPGTTELCLVELGITDRRRVDHRHRHGIHERGRGRGRRDAHGDAGYAAFFGSDGQPGHTATVTIRDGDGTPPNHVPGGCRRHATVAWFSLVARLF